MRVGFLGAGHIAGALARGWCAAPSAAPTLMYFDVAGERAAALARQTGGLVAETPQDLVAASDMVVVAVRPADVAAVLAEIGPQLDSRGLVSVAAGVKLEALRAALPSDAHVGRLMPNIAAEFGRGVFLFVPGSLGALAQPFAEALEAIGTTIELEESLFDVGTAVSGCMPGFMALIVESFAAAGEAGGLEPAAARRLALAACEGAASVVAESGDPAAVMAATATPGGMTSAGLATLRERGLEAALAAGVASAAARAKELA